MKPLLIILGGGIKGCATAAVAACCGQFDVRLIERETIGAGTTSTNHGRLHSGVSEWASRTRDLDEDVLRTLMHRQRDASQMMRNVIGRGRFPKPALYYFRTEHDWEEFRALTDRLAMPYVDCGAELPFHHWINLDQVCHAAEIPEFSFDPANTAARLAKTCLKFGGQVLQESAARRIFRERGRLSVVLDNGDQVLGDLIFNALGRWCRDIEVCDDSRPPDIAWSQWRILCLRSSVLRDRPLDRIVTVSDAAPANVLRHEHWINLDFTGVHVTAKSSPDSPQDEWRMYSDFDEYDAEVFDKARSAFPPVADLPESILQKNLFSLAGVHARQVGAKKGSVQEIFDSNSLPGYCRVFGGQATTALLDAFDIVDHACGMTNCHTPDRAELLKILQRSITSNPIEPHTPMRWNVA